MPTATDGDPRDTLDPEEAAALDTYSNTVVGVAEKLTPSVANLRVTRRSRGGHGPAGAGSGVVLTPDGFLLTSAHVVAGRERRGTAAFADGREFRFAIVGSDPLSDLAVLRAEAADRVRVGSERPSAETTPAVTDPPNPCGFPIATTSWPTRRRSASPSWAGTRSRASARRTARSESGSEPTTSNSHSRPSEKDALPRPSFRETTWAEVSMKPSGVTTTALPPPSRTRPPRTRRATRRFATDGARRWATDVTTREYASRASSSGEPAALPAPRSGPRIESRNVRPLTVSS